MRNTVIDVIVSTLNRANRLAECLRALEAQTLPPRQFSVIVIDNGSTDTTGEVVAEFCARNGNTQFLREERSGLAVARNTGLSRCQAKLVAFTDDDALPDPEWLQRIVRRFASLPQEVAAIGGEVVPIWEESRPAWLTEALLRPLSAGLRWSLSARDLLPGEWLVEVNSAYRKDLLLQFGGFPEHLGRVGEMLLSGENCVNRLMQRAGLRLFFDPDILVRHHIPASRVTRTWFRRRMFWQGVTMTLLHRYVEERANAMGLKALQTELPKWEEVVIPTSARAWADLFDDETTTPFDEHLICIEQLGYLFESQSIVLGR